MVVRHATKRNNFPFKILSEGCYNYYLETAAFFQGVDNLLVVSTVKRVWIQGKHCVAHSPHTNQR
jgi:hypothetical protein